MGGTGCAATSVWPGGRLTMRKRGYSAGDIEMVSRANWLRVLKGVWGE